MLKRRVVTSAVSMALVLSSALTLTGNQTATSSAKIDLNGKVNLAISSEPFYLDPALIQYTDDGFVASHIGEGLVRLNKKKGLLPGMATKWKHSSDFKTWTFDLRKDAKWSDGTAITAKDFVFAWRRALDPATGSLYAYQLYYLKNGKKVNSSKTASAADLASIGVKANGDYQLVVNLENPTTYFDSLTSFYTLFPINEKFYDAHKKNFCKEIKDMNFNGPYVIKSWKHGSNLTLERNPKYWNAKNIKIKTMSLDVVKDHNTAMQRLIAGKQDSCGVLGTEKKSVESKGFDVKSYDRCTAYWLKINHKSEFDGKKVLANKDIKKALAYALDRKSFADNILKDGSTAQTGIVPGGIDGEKGDFRDENGTLFPATAQVSKAKKFLSDGLKELGLKKMPTIKYLIFNNDTNKKYAQVFQQMWKKNLGIDVTIDIKDSKSYSDAANAGQYDLCFSGWSPDYNDPMTFLDLFTTSSGNNDGKFSNAKYDQLIDSAKKTLDVTKRMELLRQAEKILGDDLPVVPIFFSKSYYTTSKKLHDVVRRPFSPDPDYYWAYVTK